MDYSGGVNYSQSSEAGGICKEENRSAINKTNILKIHVANMEANWVILYLINLYLWPTIGHRVYFGAQYSATLV